MNELADEKTIRRTALIARAEHTAEDILQLDTIFEDQVELKLLVRDTLWDKLKQELIDLTSGQVEIVSGGLQYADFSKAKRL